MLNRIGDCVFLKHNAKKKNNREDVSDVVMFMRYMYTIHNILLVLRCYLNCHPRHYSVRCPRLLQRLWFSPLVLFPRK